MRSLLVTGPLREIGAYAAAASEAGWRPVEYPLLEVRHLAVDWERLLEVPPECVCLTSRNALEAIAPHVERLRGIPFAVVGGRTAAALEELGLTCSIGPMPSAKSLRKGILQDVPRDATLLWPRGSLSDKLARELEGDGYLVRAPIVYETLPRPDILPLPLCDAAFFASPSAVRCYLDHAPSTGGLLAFAIGDTTADELHAARCHGLGTILTLESPTPLALQRLLERIGP